MSNRPQPLSQRSQFCHQPTNSAKPGIEIPFPQRDLNIRSGVLKMEHGLAQAGRLIDSGAFRASQLP